MDDTPRPLTEHLEELRKRLFWILGTLAVCALGCGYFSHQVFELLMLPAIDAVRSSGQSLIAVSPPELFFTYVKSAILGGFLISLPMTLYQIWAFIAPGLYEQEKRMAVPFVVATTALFFAGAGFGYFVAFPYVFDYFISLEEDYVRTSWTTTAVFGFMARLYLAFGIAFQLPVAMVILCLAGVTSAEQLSAWRKYAIVVMFTVAAILTPPDVVSQIFLAIPLTLLYEAGILVARLLVRRRAAASVLHSVRSRSRLLLPLTPAPWPRSPEVAKLARPVSTFRRELRVLLRLALPAVGAQVGGMLLGVVDTAMLGHYEPRALAAVALANVWIFGTLVFAEGIVRGIEPIVAQAHGASDGERAGLALQQGIVLALALSLPVGALWLATESILLATGQDPEIARVAGQYSALQIPSAPFLLAYMALRSWLHARALMMPALWVVIGANVWHGVLNWVLIFGKLGAPELGALGAGISTSLSRVLSFAALLALVIGLDLKRGGWDGWSHRALSRADLRRVLALGLPLGLQIGLEVWAFAGSSLFAGRLGVHALAGHQIALNLASLSFMVPLGLAIGAGTRVGNLIGRGELAEVQRAARTALVLGALVMAFFGATFVIGRHALPALYTRESAVIATCAWILPIAAAFQIFDGLQVIGAGVLRAMGLPRPPALANAIGYYVLALPIGWWLTFEAGLGLAGLWLGLALGLAFVSAFLVLRVLRAGSGVRV